jgi:hypothetical protein
MSATKPASRPVQIEMPTALIATIDRIAAEELLSRTAWMRRVLNNAVRAARWQAEMTKQR